MASAGREAAVPAELGGESSLLSRPAWLPSKGSTPPAPRGRGQDKDAKLRKSCNCRNSRCLKLYCECFAAGVYCTPGSCTCNDCHNLVAFEGHRVEAIENALSRNTEAFEGKVTKAAKRAMMTGSNGCNCRKSACLKKYCECFFTGNLCTKTCNCMNCENYKGSALLAKKRDIL